MPEISFFYGIVIKMFLSPRNTNPVTSMPCMASI